jgi:hypothetical protein
VKALHLLPLLVACLALGACGGSDDSDDGGGGDGANREALRAYLVESQKAIKPILGAQPGEAPAESSGETRSRPRADRIDDLGQDFRLASNQLGRLEPPEELRDEHDAAVRALVTVAGEKRKQAAMVRAGERPRREGEIPPLKEYRRWFVACRDAAREADLTAAELGAP